MHKVQLGLTRGTDTQGPAPCIHDTFDFCALLVQINRGSRPMVRGGSSIIPASLAAGPRNRLVQALMSMMQLLLIVVQEGV